MNTMPQFQYLEKIGAMFPFPVQWFDLKGKCIGCNDPALKLLRSNGLISLNSDLLNCAIDDLYPKAIADRFADHHQKVMKFDKVSAFEQAIENIDAGTVNYFKVIVSPLYGDQHELLGTTFSMVDVTAYKKETDSSKDSNLLRHLRIISEFMPANVYWFDLDNIILGVNNNTLKALGTNNYKDIVGKTVYDFHSKEIADTIVSNYNEAVKKKQAIIHEECIRDIKTGKTKYFTAIKSPLYNDVGKMIGIIGVSVDITKEKQLKEDLIESRANTARFKAMSALGSMISHELRTPLMSIEANAQTLKERLPILIEVFRKQEQVDKLKGIPWSRLIEIPRDIGLSARYSGNTISTLLKGFHYNTDGVIKLETVNLNALVRKAIAGYPLQDSEKDLIEVQSTKDYKIKGAPGIITHVIHNLIKNALYIIKSNGRGKITVFLTCGRNDNDDVCLSFKDTAGGMPERVRSKIFDPFFTTKDTKTSIGLGLYFCKMLLEKINANITCESKEGEYTVFHIKFKQLDEYLS